LHLPEVSAQESVNKSFVRVRLYYLYLPMDVCAIFLHIFSKRKVKGNIFGYLYTNQTYICFSYEIAEFRIQELFEPLFKEK
jgi:hypothetical protein